MIWGVLFYGANALLHFSFLDMTMSAVSIAFLNTLFRFATVLILTPFIGMLERQICRLFRDTEPAGPEKEDFARLEARFIEHPPWPLSSAARPCATWPWRPRPTWRTPTT